MPNYSDETIADALDGIQQRRYVLPAIQREFVWGPDRMCALFDSLMRDYPISSLLYWRVSKDNSSEFRWYDFVLNYHELDAPECPVHESLPEEERTAVLDGQQRLTALNIGLRGSYAAHAKWRRYGRPESYPKKHLYLDLCAEPQLSEDRYEDQVYRFEFLEEDRAETDNASEGIHWFPVSRVLSFPRDADAGMAINEYLREQGLADHPHSFNTLFKLWSVVFQQRHISYFTETAQSLDRVLDIFIRVNKQGQPLSKSDLLMSVATAQWKDRDAREEIPATLRQVNSIAPGFGFDRDHVLKAGLVLAGVSDVGFRAETFNRENMSKLEQAWPEISRRLYLAVDLFASFGLSRDNIDAGMVLIPVAYYLHRRELEDSYLASTSSVSDRQRVRDWTIRSLLMPGIFGSGLDTLLARLRRVIDADGAQGFPSDAIEDAMAATGKSLRFDPQTVDELANSAYGKPDTFALLSILYGNVDPSRTHHVDHIFPRDRLRRDRLREAGYDGDQVERIVKQARDGLANLQLLPGGENIGKSERLPLDWARDKYPDSAALQGYLEQNDMGDAPDDLAGFLDFYEARRERLRQRLVSVLGREPGTLVETPPE
ncbi:MAG: DUF262 domain-containing protein [Solirubrobacterales bacterium]